ncbi:signal peptidase I [Pseudonocardia abyssalis]|uniref:Signal peptidase I n=1 Tax=Pseudonocardia abyssalis TaxID=2792008 RepID=A0ABS6V0D3_9PSEU|nr:signal peptidase I [Pseudonocardia abyssalis]MBW0117375.1 signal peptidase I [Pseudonocardia abyssalis]MBW0137922.1 signal peptidase I [Pseudonocardia abyssalis]
MTERIPIVGEREPEPHPMRRVLGWAAATALLLVVGLAVAVAIVPAIGGATPLTVLSGSMEPALPVGSTVIVRPRPAAEIVVGDVITFTDRDEGSVETRVVTHRVVGVEPGPVFVTRGDANNADDPGVVEAVDVRGVQWYHVPYVGLLRERLLTPPGVYFAAGVALLAVAAYLLVPRSRTPVTADRRRRQDR